MYKLLLCWRYLRTRYIALASIISVMLGVATMIVVNSVMSGFTTRDAEPHPRHPFRRGLRVAQSGRHARRRLAHGARSASIAGDQIEGMTPTVVVPAMLNFQLRRQLDHAAGAVDRHRPGDAGQRQRFQHVSATSGQPPATHELRAARGRLRHAQPPGRRRNMPERMQMRDAGWPHRREWPSLQKYRAANSTTKSKPVARPTAAGRPLRRRTPQSKPDTFDPAKEQHTGVVLGIAMAGYRDRTAKTISCVLPGDDVKLTFPTVGTAAQGRQRQLHRRRFLRKQNGRIRRQFCLRAHRQAARPAGYGRSAARASALSMPSKSSSSRAPTATPSATSCGPPFPPSSTSSRPGATSRRRSWPPCRWKRPFSTCCCS